MARSRASADMTGQTEGSAKAKLLLPLVVAAVLAKAAVTRIAGDRALMQRRVAEARAAERRWAERLEALQEAAQTLVSELDRQALLEQIVSVAERLLGVSAWNLLLLEREGLVPAVFRGLRDDWRRTDPLPLGVGLAGWVALHRQPLRVADVRVDPRFRDPQRAARDGLRAYVGLPIMVGDHVLGVLNGFARDERAFSDEDLALLTALANYAAVALANADAFAERQRAEERTSRLLAVTAVLSRVTTPHEVAQVAVTEGIAGLGATAGIVGQLTEGGRVVEQLAIRGFDVPPSAAPLRAPVEQLGQWADTIRTRSLRWVESRAALQAQYPGARSPLPDWYEAAVTAPLMVEDRVLGVLGLRFAEVRTFNQTECELILAIASQCAQALERARLYEVEREARAQAEHAVRARDEFLSIASHELRTPLTAVRGQSQLLVRHLHRGTLAPTRLEHGLRTIDLASQRLGVMIEDLLDVSRLQTGQFPLRLQEFDLVAMVEDVVSRHRESLRDGHSLDFEQSIHHCLVSGDPVRLEQVLANLLDNAVKYSPGGGVVRVRLDDGDGCIRVSVSDQGIGLPPGAAEQIFELFGRAKNASERQVQGLGLGLFVCRRIMELHGGSIHATSAGEGQGTTVTFVLPLPGGNATSEHSV